MRDHSIFPSFPHAVDNMNQTVYIVSTARTPFGLVQKEFGSDLAKINAIKLGSFVILHACARAGLAPEHIEKLFLGNVMPQRMGRIRLDYALLEPTCLRQCSAPPSAKVLHLAW